MNDGEDIPRREYYQQVIAGLGPLQKLMLDLEVAVLQKPPERIVSQYHHMPDTLEKWLEQPGGNPIWYMGDGGYSRVVWSTETGNLFLTYNSTSTAKANWDKAKPQREAVENYLKAEYERLLGHPREWRRESRAERIVNKLLEVRWTDPVPPKPAFDDPDAEVDFYTRNPFMAYTHAMDRKRHHPKLWAAVQGSVYEPLYRQELLGESSPRMKALKKGRTPLSDAERKEVERRKAVWDDGHPGVWKSRVNGKTYYICNTHRAAQIKPTLKGAIKAFTFIKTTA
jgi:hypothetical protein